MQGAEGWLFSAAAVSCLFSRLLCLLQDLYVALPVPEALRSGENASSFAFLEKELRFSQM